MPPFQPVEPIKAAVGIILTNEPEPRVLLARRSQALRFMAGYHVFPGGRIDDEEPTAPVINALDTTEARAVHAVAREIFEETGLLVGIARDVRESGIGCRVSETQSPVSHCSSASHYTPDVRRSGLSAEPYTLKAESSPEFPKPETQFPIPDLHTARTAILNSTDTFESFLTRNNLVLDATQFQFAGDWVTPAIAPIRFDTRYYIVRVHEATGEDLHIGEIDALDWYTPAAARQAWREGAIQLPPPVAYVLQNLAAYSFPDVLDHLRDCGEHTGDRPSKMEFANGIYMLPLRSPTIPPATHTNCIIIGERDLYLIDPAADDAEERALLTRQIQMLLDLGGTIKAIIISHSHPDHISAAEFCREQFGTQIWSHKTTEEQIAFKVDAYIEDGDTIEIPGSPNYRLTAIHTPGHDPGHLCFIEETTRTLIAGDLIANPGTIVVSLDHGGDMTQFIDSLERIANHPGYDTILPAHGMPLTKGPEKIRNHLEHRLWREQKIKDALATGAIAISDLLALAYDDVPPETWPLAEFSLRAHLKRLDSMRP